MSILLEALRKTEKNQKQQQAPTIYSEDQAPREPEPLKPGPLVVMIAIALIVSGWFTWRQYEPPEGLYQPPVTLPTTKLPSGGKQVAATDSSPAETSTAGSQPGAALAKPLTDDTASRPQRTPVETYQAPVTSASSSATVQTGPSTSGRSGVSGIASPSGRVVSNQGAGLPAASSAGAANNTSAPVTLDTPHIPEPISYWELPDRVRADVPVIKYSVLVYNKDPAQRFVLIDGQRLAEGDSIQQGLVVEEIRRDGVIFSYRLYKFLVKR